MSKAIASRIAGLRLVGILLILLIPMVFLSVLTLQNIQQKIWATDREKNGAIMARSIMSVALEIAEGNGARTDIAGSFKSIANAAHALGIQAPLAQLEQDVSTATSDGAKLAKLINFMQVLGTEANLLFDEHPETFFLGLSNFGNLPELLVKFHSFHSALQEAIDSNGIDAIEVKMLTYRLGTLGEAVDRARQSLNLARTASAEPARYAEALSLVESIGKDVGVTIDVLATAPTGSEWLTLSMISRQNINAASKYKAERGVWEETTQRLEAAVAKRAQELKRNMWVLLGVAAACVIFAAAAAVGMFLSTLRRLDSVEAEKQRADEARIEAELMGARMMTVNDEISTLNRELSENMKRLKEAQDELLNKGRMEQLGQLTATVAHEIRNPLGSVRTCAFLIGRKIKGTNLGIETQLERINKGVARCDGIITQLLDFSRTKEVEAKPSDLDAWLESTLQEDIESYPAQVAIECSLGLHGNEVNFDPARLRRAIGNLVSNSCEAMVGNGQTAENNNGKPPKISIETRRAGHFALISVADNGPGMTPDVLARIREPLFTTKNFGTGLGVPAVEQIARQHGGELLIASTVGVGSTFTIRIPMPENQQKEVA